MGSYTKPYTTGGEQGLELVYGPGEPRAEVAALANLIVHVVGLCRAVARSPGSVQAAVKGLVPPAGSCRSCRPKRGDPPKATGLEAVPHFRRGLAREEEAHPVVRRALLKLVTPPVPSVFVSGVALAIVRVSMRAFNRLIPEAPP